MFIKIHYNILQTMKKQRYTSTSFLKTNFQLFSQQHYFCLYNHALSFLFHGQLEKLAFFIKRATFVAEKKSRILGV